MNIPFLDTFKKLGARKKSSGAPPAEVAATPRPTVVKAEGDRLSKTVMPSAMRSAARQESSGEEGSVPPDSTAAAGPAQPRTVSFSPGRKATPRKDLPPAVAQALQPKFERAISLDLADVITQMPDGLLKPAANLDPSRRILLKASEVEKRMAEGRPSVSLGSVYQQVPEIFVSTVTPSDTRQIPLPFQKVLEAFKQMQARRDQGAQQEQSPFSEASSNSPERLRMATEPPQTAQIPPVPLAPATAQSIAAEDTGQREIPLRIPLVKQEPAGAGATALASAAPKTSPERIAFQLPPKETGEPASERVPASCGPPVSTIPGPPPGATRIPFTVVPPAVESLPKPISVAPPELAEQTTSNQKKISLALKPVLQTLPAFQLTGDANEVADDARIEFPVWLIEPQLATGRVAVTPDAFEKSLPPDCRRFFSAKDVQVPILLPLQEVLKNVPAESLRMRDDQEERESGEAIETPFSTTAAEDAKRFNQGAASIPKPASAAEETARQDAPSLDAKSAIAQVSQLPGVRACAVSFADGLLLAGNLPAEIGAEGLCAIAPALLQRFETHVLETKLGNLNAMTLHCANSTVTFFRHANISLAALHANGELAPEVREELSRTVQDLSRVYSQAEASHVDH